MKECHMSIPQQAFHAHVKAVNTFPASLPYFDKDTVVFRLFTRFVP